MSALARRLSRGRVLLLVGACSELIYLLYFARAFPLMRYSQIDTDLGIITGYDRGQAVGFVLAIAMLFVLLGVAWHCTPSGADGTFLVPVLGFGLTFMVTTSFVYPITAIDVFTYVAQGRILVHYGQNPIFVTPSQFPGDPVMPLVGGWAHLGAPYGPLGILIDSLPSLVADGNLLLNLVLLKLMFSIMGLVCAVLVYHILRQAGSSLAVRGALFVAWNPLTILEIGANGHNDAAMMLLALTGLLLLGKGRLTIGIVVLTGSALVKYATIVLVPLALAYGYGRQPTRSAGLRYVLVACESALLLLVAAYAPFWRGPETLHRGLLENSFYVASLSSVLHDLVLPFVPAANLSVVGKLLFVPVYLHALNGARRGFQDLLRSCFITLFSLLGLAVNNFKAWYGVWPTMLAACTPARPVIRAMLIFGCAVLLSPAAFMYGGAWFGSRVPDVYVLINSCVYVLDFLPAVLVLAGAAYARPHRLPGWRSNDEAPPEMVAARKE